MNNIQNNTLTFNYFSDFSHEDVAAKKTQLKEFVKGSGFASATKSLPRALQGEVKKAGEALKRELKKLHANHSSLAWPKNQETLAQHALSFNRVVKGSDGVTTVPVGLIALAILKKPKKELSAVAEKVAEMTVNQTFEEYQKFKLQQVEKMQKLQTPSAPVEKPEKKAETAPVKAPLEAKQPEKTTKTAPEVIVSKTETPAAAKKEPATNPESSRTEASPLEEEIESEKIEKEEPVREPRAEESKRESKAAKKKGFFSFIGSFFSLFKNLFLGVFKFFSAKKSK